MKIIDFYIAKQVIKSSLLTLLVFVLIFAFFHFLEELDNHYPISAKLEYLIYALPKIADTVLVFSFFIGTVIALGMLTENKENHIFVTGTLSLRQIIFKSIFFSISVSIILLVVSEIFTPNFTSKSIEIKALASNQHVINSNKNIWIKKGSTFINISEAVSEKKLNKLTEFEFDDEMRLIKIQTSKVGIIKDDSLELQQTFSVNLENINGFDALSPEYRNTKESSLQLTEFNSFSKKVSTMNLLDLFSFFFDAKENNLNYNEYINEIFSRLLKPLNLLALLLLGLPLVINLDRTASLSKLIFIGVSLALVINLSTKILDITSQRFGMSIFLSSSIPTITLLIAGVIFFTRKMRLKI